MKKSKSLKEPSEDTGDQTGKKSLIPSYGLETESTFYDKKCLIQNKIKRAKIKNQQVEKITIHVNFQRVYIGVKIEIHQSVSDLFFKSGLMGMIRNTYKIKVYNSAELKSKKKDKNEDRKRIPREKQKS